MIFILGQTTQPSGGTWDSIASTMFNACLTVIIACGTTLQLAAKVIIAIVFNMGAVLIDLLVASLPDVVLNGVNVVYQYCSYLNGWLAIDYAFSMVIVYAGFVGVFFMVKVLVKLLRG